MQQFTKNKTGACPYCASHIHTHVKDRNDRQSVYLCECGKHHIKTNGTSYPLFDASDPDTEPVTIGTV